MSARLMALSGKQRRYLRSLGHHLNPVVLLGKHGITDALVAAADEAITTHELIKIKRGGECPDTRQAIADALSEALGADLVQQLGNTVLLYRKHPKDPQIELPR